MLCFDCEEREGIYTFIFQTLAVGRHKEYSLEYLCPQCRDARLPKRLRYRHSPDEARNETDDLANQPSCLPKSNLELQPSSDPDSTPL